MITDFEIKLKIQHIQSVIKLFSNDLNIHLTESQMIELLSADQHLLALVLNGQYKDVNVKQLLYNQLSQALLGHDWPSDRAMSNMDSDEFTEFMCELIGEACDKGYRYDTDPRNF